MSIDFLVMNRDKKNLSPIRVELVNINKSLCPWDRKISNLSLEGIKIHCIYLSNYKDVCHNDNASDVDKTHAMLTATSYKKLKELAKGSTERMALYIMIRKLAENPEFMELYDKEAYEMALKKVLRESGHKAGWAEGEKTGHKKGFLESKIEIAKKLFQMNMKLEDFSKVTELS